VAMMAICIYWFSRQHLHQKRQRQFQSTAVGNILQSN